MGKGCPGVLAGAGEISYLRLNQKWGSMRFFKFFIGEDIRAGLDCDEDEWVYRFGRRGKFAWASLKTPVLKEVTESKGITVRYLRHYVYCLGRLRANGTFWGLVFFDPLYRLLLFLLAFGIGCSSGSILTGLIVGAIFYLLWSLLSAGDDSLFLAMLRKRLRW